MIHLQINVSTVTDVRYFLVSSPVMVVFAKVDYLIEHSSDSCRRPSIYVVTLNKCMIASFNFYYPTERWQV